MERARLQFTLFFSLSTDSVDEEEALSKLGPYGHDLCRGVLFLRRNPVRISIDELYVRWRGQRGPTGRVLARAPTALPGGRARLIARVWSRACVTEPAPTGLPPSRADGSPENFSPAAFAVAHMYVCISASVSRSWYSSRKLWGKSFQESRRRVQAGHAARRHRTVRKVNSLFISGPPCKLLTYSTGTEYLVGWYVTLL